MNPSTPRDIMCYCLKMNLDIQVVYIVHNYDLTSYHVHIIFGVVGGGDAYVYV